MEDWKIERSQKKCDACEANFGIGQDYRSCILDQPEGFVRRDYCVSCWESQSVESESFATWEAEIAPVRKPKLIVDDTVLLDFFNRLENEKDQTKIEFRYILALMLMRKRHLKFEDVRQEGEFSIMDVSVRGGGQVAVQDPGISEGRIVALQDELKAIFTVDFEEQKPESILCLASSDVRTLGDFAGKNGFDKIVVDSSVQGIPLSASLDEAEGLREHIISLNTRASIYNSGLNVLQGENPVAAFDQWMMRAKAMGAKTIILHSDLSAQEDSSKAVRELAGRLRKIARRARKYKVLPVLQDATLFADGALTRTLIKIMGNAPVGFCVEPCAFADGDAAQEFAQEFASHILLASCEWEGLDDGAQLVLRHSLDAFVVARLNLLAPAEVNAAESTPEQATEATAPEEDLGAPEQVPAVEEKPAPLLTESILPVIVSLSLDKLEDESLSAALIALDERCRSLMGQDASAQAVFA